MSNLSFQPYIIYDNIFSSVCSQRERERDTVLLGYPLEGEGRWFCKWLTKCIFPLSVLLTTYSHYSLLYCILLIQFDMFSLLWVLPQKPQDGTIFCWWNMVNEYYHLHVQEQWYIIYSCCHSVLETFLYVMWSSSFFVFWGVFLFLL